MPNRNQKRKSAAKDRADNGLAQINYFFNWFTPEEAQENLWQMFHYSMLTDERGVMDSDARRQAFFFYERLKELLNASGAITGLRIHE